MTRPRQIASKRQDEDTRFLTRKTRPPYEEGASPIAIADLFCGCGGMTLGIAEAARRLGRATDIRLAIDIDDDCCTVFRTNFPGARVESLPVELLLSPDMNARLTLTEAEIRSTVGQVDFLVGGPPCQGHSDLNNRTRRADARNGLYGYMARAAAVLNPKAVIIENVPRVLKDRGAIVSRTASALSSLGYRVGGEVIDLLGVGVAQRRQRHVLVATLPPLMPPADVFALLRNTSAGRSRRDVRWAIGDLNGRKGDQLHASARVSADNVARIEWLHRECCYELPDEQRPTCHRTKQHSYKSVYGRLRWNEPAQTITTGFSSMGQGRNVHPSAKRTLTPREAARLQFLPDFFDLQVVPRRSSWARMIGNAVPPKLTMALGKILIPHL